jgi:hypothetical protein
MANYPTEPKVKAATGGALLAGCVDWVLSQYVFHGNVPQAVTLAVSLAVSAGLTWGAGYITRHQYRPGEAKPK